MRKMGRDVVRSKEVVHLKGDTSVHEAARVIREHNIGSVLVMDGERLDGIVTVADMAYRVVAEGLDPDKTILAEVMTANPDTISRDSAAIEALRMMQDGGYRHLPVVDGDKVIGVVSRRDFFGTEEARLDEETNLWERIA